jgi:hypothetical protein
MGIAIPNLSIAEAGDIEVPVRAPGTPYEYEMICDNGWTRFYGENTASLLGHLIPGYETLSEYDQAVARIQHAINTQTGLQAALLVALSDTERTDAEQAILTADRRTQPHIELWSCDIPLVLIDAFYAPYTTIVRPVSAQHAELDAPNVWWLNPGAGEHPYLISLANAGVIGLHQLTTTAGTS